MVDKATIFKTSLDVLHYSGAGRLLARGLQGIGAIFMLHHVRPGGGLQPGFAPNRGLEVTPEFLDAVIAWAKAHGYDLVSLAEAVEFLKRGEVPERPFVAFTLDDGYLDNFEHAWPIFRKHDCPFTIFVAPAITDGRCELWWRGLEAVIARTNRLMINSNNMQSALSTQTPAEKQAAFERVYWPVRQMPEDEQRRWIRDLCNQHDIDLAELCRAEAMTWDQVRDISADPLCTIGAHTVNHFAVAKLTPHQVMDEACRSRARIAEEIGYRPSLFAYPYGDETSAGPRDFRLIAEAGFAAAVTTRKGLVYRDHGDHLTALPRVSLNGDYQKIRYVEALMTGAPFALWNRFRKVNAA